MYHTLIKKNIDIGKFRSIHIFVSKKINVYFLSIHKVMLVRFKLVMEMSLPFVLINAIIYNVILLWAIIHYGWVFFDLKKRVL